MGEQMNNELRNQLAQYFEEQEFYEATRSILRMNVNAEDVNDELLDSFEPAVRRRIFPLLPVWCKESTKAILERRAKTETDEECKRSIAALLLTFGGLKSDSELWKVLRRPSVGGYDGS